MKVIEIGRFASAPSCATALADWGADVVKIEPLSGDPARGPGSVPGAGQERAANPRFEVHNRSRRSVALNLATPTGRAAADRLIAQADVLVTNLSPRALDKLGLTGEILLLQHPRLILAQITGYDADTPKARERSYDHGGYWSYSGAAAMFAAPDGEPPQPTGGFGDRAAGTILAGAVAAALYGRQQTGRGTHVRTSLVNTALWLMASDVSDIVSTGRTHRSPDRRLAAIPTVNSFRTSDGRWLWLQLMLPESSWSRLLSALDATWLDEDPRFRGGVAAKLKAAQGPLTELLDEVFGSRTLAEWDERLSAHDITWAPVQTLEETVNDPAIRGSSAFIDTLDEHGGRRTSVNTPCSFVGSARRAATRAPAIGEHTEEVLAAHGFTIAEIRALQQVDVDPLAVSIPLR